MTVKIGFSLEIVRITGVVSSILFLGDFGISNCGATNFWKAPNSEMFS